MVNKKMVQQMVKLQVLCVRWVERNTNLRCSTFADMDRILQAGKLTTTYGEAIKNLKKNIEQYCKNSVLIEEVSKLEEDINNSDIKELRFGIEPQRKFTPIEKELDNERIKRQLYMTGEMVGIKYIVENLGLTESAVKQACQQQRILNTKKIGKSWIVHIPECRAYWNIQDTDNSHLYQNWEY